ncbi:hypothetical protein C8R46DRAFT_1121514, partial [Mycena filopes]
MSDDSTLPGSLWSLFVRELLVTSTAIFFYGLYVNLFILAVYTLHRRRTSGRTWLLAASGMLFVVGTLQTILRILNLTVLGRAMSLLVNSSPGEAPTAQIIAVLQNKLQLELADNAVFAVNGFITDSVFLYRCYLIWGSRLKPIILPTILILATATLAIISVASSTRGGRVEFIATTTAYVLDFTTNLVLMALTAGRIWWTHRTVSKLYSPSVHGSIDIRSNAAMSIILESGSLY